MSTLANPVSTAIRLDFHQVRAALPQSYPFLFLDRVSELIPGQRIVAHKNITGNEWMFPGHFPGRAIYPGVLLLESMAQASILLFKFANPTAAGMFLLAGVRSRFLHQVVPGDALIIECIAEKLISTGAVVAAEIKLGAGQAAVAKATLTFALRPQDEKTHDL